MVAAALRAASKGVRSMVGYSYRRVPAVALARRLVEQGRIGELRHVRAQYLQDWIVDPQFPLVWRLQKDAAGSGALGDIGAHIVDMAQYLTGDLLTANEEAGLQELREAAAHARRAGLLARAAVAMQGARLHGLVDARHEPAELLIRARRIARADRVLEPAEPRLDLRSAAPVLEALALRPMNPLFL